MDGIFQEFFDAGTRLTGLVLDSRQQTYWLYLLISVVLALTISWAQRADEHPARRSVLRTLFDRAIWLHRSAVVDYFCYAINTIIAGIFRIGGLFSGALVSLLLYPLLLSANSGAALALPAEAAWLAIFTMSSLIWLDLGKYLSHVLSHRVPLLWEFHKVHHSAQVLTPITAYRFHPLELVFYDIVDGLFIGASGAIALFVFGSRLEPLTILGLNAGMFLFYALGASLRHSHVWLPYPAWLSRILLSPAQHQIHHSTLPQHHDANFGVLFAWWDWLFGTLYIPRGREPLAFGLHAEEDREYQSAVTLYVVPFKKAWARVWTGPAAEGPTRVTPLARDTASEIN
jgi:sterol desaturase/sphingolipid hydroxylase (fatty acid hydroxylase superfamily)